MIGVAKLSLKVAFSSIYVCVLTCNRLAQLRRLVESIGPALINRPVVLVVLDQASADGTPDYLSGDHPLLLAHIHSAENLGCAGGRQYMVDTLSPCLLADDILVFLDDDCYATNTTWLGALTAPIRQGLADISGVDGRTVDADGMTHPVDSGYDYVSGGRMAVRAEVFTRCAFDLRYNPNYYEDVDFCLEATAAGFRVQAVGDVGLAHDAHPGEPEQAERSRLENVAKWAGRR